MNNEKPRNICSKKIPTIVKTNAIAIQYSIPETFDYVNQHCTYNSLSQNYKAVIDMKSHSMQYTLASDIIVSEGTQASVGSEFFEMLDERLEIERVCLTVIDMQYSLASDVLVNEGTQASVGSEFFEMLDERLEIERLCLSLSSGKQSANLQGLSSGKRSGKRS
eukprot:Pgem_evm1s18757